MKKLKLKYNFKKFPYEIINNSNCILSYILDNCGLNLSDCFFICDKIVFHKYIINSKFYKINKDKIILSLVPGKKDHKNFKSLIKIYKALDKNNCPRDINIIAIGGGVIGDIGAFAASTWYRGTNLIHVPTSLMAMIDSSIGGKTAINFQKKINSIGTFYDQNKTICNIGFLKTLPNEDYLSAFSETIKVALLKSPSLLNKLVNNPKKIKTKDPMFLMEIISKSVIIKSKLINDDWRDLNKRMILNFGHTFGHAIEVSVLKSKNSHYYNHGMGVGLGILAALKYSSILFEKNYFFEKKIKMISNFFKTLGLDNKIISKKFKFHNKIDLANKIYSNMLKDKKRSFSGIRLIYLKNNKNAAIDNKPLKKDIMNSILSIID